MFNQDFVTFAAPGKDFRILETTPFSRDPERARHKATGALLGTIARAGGKDASTVELFFAWLRMRAFGWDEYRALATSIDRELLVPTSHSQACQEYGSALLQFQIWSAARYAKCADRILKHASGEPEADAASLLTQLRQELQIAGGAVTAQGLADSLYIEMEEK